MKRIIAIVLCMLGTPSITAAQQGGREAPPPPSLEPGASQADVDLALIAAPANLRDQATVIKWKAGFTYDTLRKGTNRLVCYDRTVSPLDRPFSVQCTSVANLERVAQSLRAEAQGDRNKSGEMLNALEREGKRIKPEFGSTWYSLSGPDRDHIGEHQVTIAVPGATAESLGLPDNPRAGGAWIMNAGTSTAHIMVPGR